ncbi:MAG: DUF2779 domain-containing protein [Gammaproteobacteria bacterium]
MKRHRKKIRALSKSKLMAYRQCPKRLWLEVHAADKKTDSPATERSFRIGHQAGEVAQQIYDPNGRGVLVNPQHDGFTRAIEQSMELMQQDRPVFEATFSTGQALALADVMLPAKGKAGGWKMIEVKSATSVKEYYHDDVAIQMYIATTVGVDIRQLVLAHIDNQWVYPGKRQYQGLFREVDMTGEASGRNAEVKQWIKEGQKIVERPTPPDIKTGEQCDEPYQCGFYDLCHTDEGTEFPVHWLPGVGKKKINRFYDKGIEDMREVPDADLSTRQERAKNCTINDSVYADHAGAQKKLLQHKLPAYFLDFESIQFAVPLWAGTRPYQQLVFQYSMHRLDKEGKLQHRGFLDLSGDDPSRAVAEALVRDCGKKGPVFVYHAGFEKTRINELAARFDDLAEALHAINKRLVDLLPIIREHYYHPEQQGSFSLKYVLPAVAPDLDYSELEGVQDGGMAMDAYAEAIQPDTPAARKQEIEQQLLKYCERDTFALVRLWQFLQQQTPTPLV